MTYEQFGGSAQRKYCNDINFTINILRYQEKNSGNKWLIVSKVQTERLLHYITPSIWQSCIHGKLPPSQMLDIYVYSTRFGNLRSTPAVRAASHRRSMINRGNQINFIYFTSVEIVRHSFC